MNIVFLDRMSIGSDLDLSEFEALGEVTMYDFSTPAEVRERVLDADIIIVNKTPVNEETIGPARHLKLVCVTATGTNNLDKEYLDARGIEVVVKAGKLHRRAVDVVGHDLLRLIVPGGVQDLQVVLLRDGLEQNGIFAPHKSPPLYDLLSETIVLRKFSIYYFTHFPLFWQ